MNSRSTRSYCYHFFILWALSLLPIQSLGQMVNDDIWQAKHLVLNTTYESNTIHCTVQWNCVDQKLTGKCIEYHNDQWFVFNSLEFSSLYVNLSNQSCRDKLGVQIVILEGEVCMPETYKVLDCVSLANHNDIFLKLKGLKPLQDYLINIDGYLHDYCHFSLEVSETPKGISAKPYDLLPLKKKQEANVVHIKWELPDSLKSEIFLFKLFRKRNYESKFKQISKMSLIYNAYGKVEKLYSYTDTLTTPEQFEYKLVAEKENGENLSISDFRLNVDSEDLHSFLNNHFQIQLDFKNKTPISIFIFDYFTNRLLQSKKISFEQHKHRWFTLDKSEFKSKGHNALIIKVVDNDSGQQDTYEINL